MEEKDFEKGLDALGDFFVFVWNKIFWPLLEGLGTLIATLPDLVKGGIVGVLLIVWAYRKIKG